MLSQQGLKIGEATGGHQHTHSVDSGLAANQGLQCISHAFMAGSKLSLPAIAAIALRVPESLTEQHNQGRAAWHLEHNDDLFGRHLIDHVEGLLESRLPKGCDVVGIQLELFGRQAWVLLEGLQQLEAVSDCCSRHQVSVNSCDISKKHPRLCTSMYTIFEQITLTVSTCLLQGQQDAESGLDTMCLTGRLVKGADLSQEACSIVLDFIVTEVQLKQALIAVLLESSANLGCPGISKLIAPQVDLAQGSVEHEQVGQGAGAFLCPNLAPPQPELLHLHPTANLRGSLSWLSCLSAIRSAVPLPERDMV